MYAKCHNYCISNEPLNAALRPVMDVLNVDYDCYSSSVNNLVHHQVDQSFNLDRKLDLLDSVLDCPEAKSITAFLCVCGVHVYAGFSRRSCSCSQTVGSHPRGHRHGTHVLLCTVLVCILGNECSWSDYKVVQLYCRYMYWPCIIFRPERTNRDWTNALDRGLCAP